MFQHSVFSLPFIFIGMIVAADGWFGWRLLALGVVAAVSARNYAMLVNRYLDRDIDALNPRTKNRPSVDGRFSAAQMKLLIVVNAFIFIATAYAINRLAFWLSFPILAVLGGYSLFKRFSETAHLVLGLSLGLAPVAGAVAVTGSIPMWSLMLAVGVMFWVAGFDLLYSLQDIDFDKEAGLHSIPSRYGSACTMFLARIFHALAVLFWAFFTAQAHLGLFAWLAVAVAAGMLWYEHRIVAKDFTKIDRAFFTVNGYLGFAYLALIVLDRSVA
ncbi:menaquinone biosynthesis prenyltransferase MqnP [Hydrogenimonas sp. SS33]|uniref:menaquinone biosynthesis prenyltransferase MqnP n=1 Tax=Hydrogenimonas leucolamina TaxID=2954236 RepID=UPI00336C0938